MCRSAICFVLLACLAVGVAAPADARIIRVKWASPADGPGNDWDHAYRTVTAAIAASAAGDEIWVAGDAAHPYVENVTLKDGVGLYGGFAGGETTRDERQWWVNETILDGGEAGSVVTVARGVSAATVLSGFTIRNGKAASGGGIYCYGASPAILNNRITGNTATTVGAGITIASSSGVVASCLIVSNSGAQAGNGIYCTAGSPRLVNNTVVGNSSVSQGAIVLSATSAVLANSIIAFNSSGVVKSGGTPSLKNNCVFGNTAYDYAGFVTDPTGTDGNISEDPAFAYATAGDYRLTVESLCVQAGDNAQVGAHWRDLGGQPRVGCWLVDMGAYELDPDLIEHGIIRVKWDSPNDGPGNDWDHAYHTVTAAIATSVAGDEIWVAGDSAHPYVERITLKDGVIVCGGFAGHETSVGERDRRANRTVLDGSGSGSVVTAPADVTAVAVVDGFVIRNGNDGIRCSSSRLQITNITISGNEGYGIYCSSSSPSVTNNTISGNRYGIGCDSSSPSITNNTIAGNGYYGIRCSFSSPSITNNTISGNGTDGILCSSSSPTITNNIVAFNATGIHKYSGTPVLGCNCVFNPDGTNYYGLTAGTGDISENPLFADRAAGNLRILPGSRCIDTGDDAGMPPWLIEDKDGNPRISGAHVDIGAYEFQHPATSIPHARGGKDGAQVSLTGVIVTAAWPDVFYVEQPDRACGIRVEKAGHGLVQSQTAAVTGQAVLASNGEVSVLADSVAAAGTGSVEPVIVRNVSLGGAGSGLQPGILGSLGLNNIGLLVRTAGTVSAPRVQSGWFYVDDGSGAWDGTGVGGIYVDTTGLLAPPAGSFAAVTGISSCEWYDGNLVNVLRPRSQVDISFWAPVSVSALWQDVPAVNPRTGGK